MIAALVVVLAIAGGITYTVGFRGDDEPTASIDTNQPSEPQATETAEQTPAPEITTGAAKDVKLGVFRGTKPSELDEFADWLDADVPYALDYSNRNNWKQVANPTYMLDAWQNKGYRMVYGVVMLPTRDDTVSLAAGADGDYDQHFKTLAEHLVDYDQGDSIIRLAWEFNVPKGRWELATEDRKNFIAYWRNIVTAMRSVPGAEKLQFDWNVNNGGEVYDSTIFYPGDKYVDYIGVDVYDISWAEDTYPYPDDCSGTCRRAHQELAWGNIVDAAYGLGFWSKFAESRGKPMSLPEWGMWDRAETDGHGGADNPYFIQKMYEFIDDPRNNVAYQAYFDVDPAGNGQHKLSGLPNGEKRFKKLFGAGS